MNAAPELLSPAWFSALLSIVLIDLVLAGDNAIVIGLAARNVPTGMQRKVVWWGTAGAIVVRAILTGLVVSLLKVPGFLLAGGLALVFVGWKLTRDEPAQGHAIAAKASFRGAVQTIVVADAVMGVDNVLAVGGAAHGSWLLVVLGLAISVQVVVWGSTLVLRWVERCPAIVWLGAAVLGWTAAKMMITEPLLAPLLDRAPRIAPFVQVLVVVGMVAPPVWRTLRPRQRREVLALATLGLWLVAWGIVERRLDALPHPLDNWTLLDEVVDFLRWTGWIPLLLVLFRSNARVGIAARRG